MKRVSLTEYLFEREQFKQSLHPSDYRQSLALKQLVKVIDNELTDYQKKLVDMYYYQEYTMNQIADILGINQSTVSRNLKTIRNKIFKYLKYLIL